MRPHVNQGRLRSWRVPSASQIVDKSRSRAPIRIQIEASGKKAACIRTLAARFPDSVSRMNCAHQRLRVERPQSGHKYGDDAGDTNASHEVYRR